MAETFFCNSEMVHMTNGGCHELYLSWAKCAKALKYKKLESLLIEKTKCGLGVVADGIDEEYLTEEFCVFTALYKTLLVNSINIK